MIKGEGEREGEKAKASVLRARPPPRGHRFGNGRETMPNAAAVRLPPPIRLASVTRRDRGWRRRDVVAVIFQLFS